MPGSSTAAPRRLVCRMTLAAALLVGSTSLFRAMPAQATLHPLGMSDEQGLLCRYAIQQAEFGSGLPQNILVGIARVESGRRDPVSGRFHPWPWTINADGKGYFFERKSEAIAFARQLQARGVRSFDVGCMQVNMMHHAGAFRDLEEAFDPSANARYAVKFLRELKEKTGSWETASAWYHSANPEYGTPYRSLVVSAMAIEAKNPAEYASLRDPGSTLGDTGGHGTISALHSMPTGGIPAMPQGTVQAFNGMRSFGASTGPGRDLDAYRLQPVTMVGRQVAAR